MSQVSPNSWDIAQGVEAAFVMPTSMGLWIKVIIVLCLLVTTSPLCLICPQARVVPLKSHANLAHLHA